MRRIIGILVLVMLVICLTFLAGCSLNEDSASDMEIEVTTDGGISGGKEIKANAKDGVKNTESSDEQGKYLTDPVPEGNPEPINPQDTQVKKTTTYQCTISIVCDTVLDNMESLTAGKEDIVPTDGIILAATKIQFYEGENVFDVLLRVTKDQKIHMEFVATPIYNSNYLEGINNLYEFDCGPLSGWMYKVNDWFPNYGCSRYLLKDGDVIEFIYTCDLGEDIGGGAYTQQSAE